MLRIGSIQYASHLAELMSNLLSSFANEEDKEEYERYLALYKKIVVSYQQLKSEKLHVVSLRNKVDHVEQQTSGFYQNWGIQQFGAATKEEAMHLEKCLHEYESAYQKWLQSRNSLVGKFMSKIEGAHEGETLDQCLSRLHGYLRRYKQEVSFNSTDSEEEQYKVCSAAAEHLIHDLKEVSEYHEALRELTSARPLEDIDKELVNTKSSLSNIAQKLWNQWLTVQPLEMDRESREEIQEYVTTMKLLENTDVRNNARIKQKFNHLQSKMTSFMTSWAVTSLSAKGRIPFQAGLFDLVVIDEASQCDIASVLPMLFRAKQAVIIGDPKQLGHITSLSKMQDYNLLEKYHLNSVWSYSASSLYDRASLLTDFDQIIQLRDHHRSFADIIEFSNKEFYGGKLRVATSYDRLKRPVNVPLGIHWFDVKGRTIRPEGGSILNESEASMIVKSLEKLIVNYGFDGSVGVVTPFRAQVIKIQELISKNPDLAAGLEKNDFIVDTIHKFQGDEKDVMFFSPVISQGTRDSSLNFLKSTGQLFNVAVTRARSVLIVVGDKDFCSSCGVPYMEHFVKYCDHLASKEQKNTKDSRSYPSEGSYPPVSNPEQVSDWERYFYTVLYNQGIRTILQYSEEKYKLDLALFDGDRKLDIEVDGEMYHRDWNYELSYRDQLRNQRLFELGWDVKRFWVYQIRDDLQGCINQIKDWLNRKQQ